VKKPSMPIKPVQAAKAQKAVNDDGWGDIEVSAPTSYKV
jgi:hypothetical protein